MYKTKTNFLECKINVKRGFPNPSAVLANGKIIKYFKIPMENKQPKLINIFLAVKMFILLLHIIAKF